MRKKTWLALTASALLMFGGAFGVHADAAEAPVLAETVTDSYAYLPGIGEGEEVAHLFQQEGPVAAVMPASAAEGAEAESPVVYTYEQIVNYIRDEIMLAWVPDTVTFTCRVDNEEDFSKACSAAGLGEAVFAHGTSNNMRSGDYLRYTNGWKLYLSAQSYGDGSSFAYADFTYTITPMPYTTAAQEAEFDTAVTVLLNEWKTNGMITDAMTDYEKICTIYSYICESVDYDYENLNDPNHYLKYTAYAALINKTSVCQGYANLFYRLARELGIDARIVSGTGIPEYPDYAGSGPHAWNIVELGEDVYYYLDATWDERAPVDVNNSSPVTNNWFLKGRSPFELSHVREEEFLNDTFLEEYPVSAIDFNPEYENAESITDTYGDIRWTLAKDGTLTLTLKDTGAATGKMPEHAEYAPVPWYSYNERIKNAVIDEKITTISGMAFWGCKKLTSVTIEGTITDIGHHAFSGSGLTQFTVPATVTNCEGAFSGSTNLTALNVDLANPYYSFENGILYYRESGDGENAPAVTLTYYPPAAEKTFTVPEDVTGIGNYAFDGLGMEKIILPAGLETIGVRAFSDSMLSDIEFSANVTTIGDYAFEDSTELKSAKFYGDMPEMGRGVFENVRSDFRITYRKSAKGWTESENVTPFIYYGDVSADGFLNEQDGELAKKHFAGWKVEIDTEAIDFNRDGEPNRKDAMYFARYLDGWAGYVLPNN